MYWVPSAVGAMGQNCWFGADGGGSSNGLWQDSEMTNSGGQVFPYIADVVLHEGYS